MLGNQRFVIRLKPCLLLLLISFRFTLEKSSNYNKLLLSKCLHKKKKNKILNNNIIVTTNNKGYNILNN